ncbi:MAG: LysM peptidoglycan-binding domain-containing protein [Chloroflexi bacterium]|nr:LysM peptidoglycan-binding domain-containing protein [Chloroflexota bacterium]MYF22869.1 LysM peptidoglycan-binding domain-containing protein [Chloroflexota bacterium]
MSSNQWTDRRAAVASRLLVVMLVAGSLVLSGCGLFGGDDETPSVVEPPESVTQAEQQDTTPAVGADEEQDQPVEAVQVTTSPDEQSEQETEAEAVEAQEEEPADSSIYVVQAGDTLADIAGRLGVRLDDLITLNGIQNPDRISVGQVLQVPVPQANEGDTETVAEDSEDEQESQESEDEDDQQVEPPAVTLPTVAVPAATPTRVSYTQFPQPGSDETTDTIPDPPTNFLQYGAAALPWLHGIAEVTPIIELFKAWPMPPLAVGNDRVVLVDTGGFGSFSVSIVYTDPNSFGAAVRFSNLVVYDPLPGTASRYRVGYDHVQAYAREVQGIQQLSDLDLSGDGVRDLTFREITCDETGCVSSFYILSAVGDGYQTITGSTAQVAEVSNIAIEDRTGDGVLDLVVTGLATDESVPARYTFVFTARGVDLVEALRVSVDGGSQAADDGDELGE